MFGWIKESAVYEAGLIGSSSWDEESSSYKVQLPAEVLQEAARVMDKGYLFYVHGTIEAEGTESEFYLRANKMEANRIRFAEGSTLTEGLLTISHFDLTHVETEVADLMNDVTDLQTAITDHETRIVLLENIEKDRGLTKEEIYAIVTSGQADKYFQIGEQIESTWNDGTHEYDFPWDIVAIRDVVNENDHVVPGMILQAHWLVPDVQFDASEAIYVVPDGETLAPGTYYITMGVNWGTHVVYGKSYTFTTIQTLQAGGQILFARSGNNRYTWGAPDQNPSTWVCYTYKSNADDTPLDTLTLTEGATGTSLGTVYTSAPQYSESGLNNLQRAAYGYNRDKHSAIRQFLNSDAAAGAWWTPQNPFDRTPQQLATMRGFMAGLPEDFLAMINKVKITTALNTVTDSLIGTSESYYDKFFLPSLEEEYCVPQLSGVEGAYWPYWKDRLELTSPQASGSANANPNHIRYLASNHSSAAYVRLRSAIRGSANATWSVYSTGYVSHSYATSALASAPACVICSSD